MITLLPHQITGRDFLVSHPRALLADGMRVGKSVQSVTAAEKVYYDSEDLDFTVVVICPASLRTQWRRQFAEFSTWEFSRVVLSYEEAVKHQKELVKNRIDILIVDEAHYCKNRKSNRTEAVFGALAGHATRVWCLTGTPSPNNASELWPMLHALFPETITAPSGKPMNYWQFVKRFCKVVETPFGQKIEGNRNTDDLKQRMAPIMLRRPSSILGNVILPPETLYLDASAAELKRLEADLRQELGSAYATAPQLMNDKVKARIGRLTGLAKVPALVERLKDEFGSGLDKVVIAAWHQDVIEAVCEGLKDYGALVSHGGVPTAQRDANAAAFQNDPAKRAIGINVKAEGVGRDFTAACELIFAETSWVPGDNEQAAMRITGVNQKRAARVRYAVLPGSIDERLTEVNRRKSRDIAALFG